MYDEEDIVQSKDLKFSVAYLSAFPSPQADRGISQAPPHAPVGGRGGIRNLKRLSPSERALLTLKGENLEAFIGIMLGDGSLQLRGPLQNARFHFGQSGKLEKRGYYEQVFNLFLPYLTDKVVSQGTVVRDFVNPKGGANYTKVNFSTMALPCFTYYYHLFYVGGVKVVPQLILELLSPCGLAH